MHECTSRKIVVGLQALHDDLLTDSVPSLLTSQILISYGLHIRGASIQPVPCVQHYLTPKTLFAGFQLKTLHCDLGRSLQISDRGKAESSLFGGGGGEGEPSSWLITVV